MEYSEVIRSRHSVRRFERQQIRLQNLSEIIAEAQRAPSWVNAQERKVYIAAKNIAKSIRDEYKRQAEQGMIGVSDFSFTHRNEWSQSAQNNMNEFETGIEHFLGDDAEELVRVQDELFDAPAIVFLTLPKEASKWAIMDLGAFEMAIMLSAANKGIASMLAYAFVKYPEIIRSIYQYRMKRILQWELDWDMQRRMLISICIDQKECHSITF